MRASRPAGRRARRVAAERVKPAYADPLPYRKILGADLAHLRWHFVDDEDPQPAAA